MKTLIALLTAFLALVMPIKAMVLTVICFVGLDTITGIYASVKTKGRRSFRSGHLFNIVPKTFLYSSTILLGFLIDKFIVGGSLLGIAYLLSKTTSVIWVWVEVLSIDENSQKLGNRSFWTIIKGLIAKVKGLKKDINEIIRD